MGVVYLARHRATGEEVAIKTVRLRRQGLLHRIRREVHALARIRHPGLVRIIATGLLDGLPWYAMEPLRGATLHDVLRRSRADAGRHPAGPPTLAGRESGADFVLAWEHAEAAGPVVDGTTATVVGGPYPSPGDTAADASGLDGGEGATFVGIPAPLTSGPEPPDPTEIGPEAGEPGWGGRFAVSGEERTRFLTLIARLCRSLAYLHGEGIVHRDIKPRNVIIRPDGTPVLLDFGLASYFGVAGRESLEVGGKVEGTPEYMSPEQVRGELVDARADLYAVGCILYEGLTGRVPFRATSRCRRSPPGWSGATCRRSWSR